jgi:hypothetical protein
LNRSRGEREERGDKGERESEREGEREALAVAVGSVREMECRMRHSAEGLIELQKLLQVRVREIGIGLGG